MAKSKNSKPTFGREMEPCEYYEKWANKMPKEKVVIIPAEDTIKEKEEETR